MAKVIAKKKIRPEAQSDEDTSPEDVLDRAEAAVGPADEDSNTEDEEDHTPVVRAPAAKDKDHVRVVFLRAVDPAPVIGNYDFREAHGIQRIAQGAELRVPLHVAQRLHDAKACIIG